jgi:hypothetical protein
MIKKPMVLLQVAGSDRVILYPLFVLAFWRGALLDLHAFNLVMLAKQSWRLISNLEIDI